MAYKHGFRIGGTLRFRSAQGKRWPLALMAGAGLLAAAPSADAASLFWPDSDVGYFYDEPPPPPKRRAKVYPKLDHKLEQQHKLQTTAKPQGPLVISVSIDRQLMKIYDSNGLFAETPVSTGMRGHSTPMGVFSIIQKSKYHRSNLYSGAPMPYMQRITWSGVALHAGALPGYPASHGCIRMPMSFAMKLWTWTRMGARVVIAPGELAPESFVHPMLVAQKPAPSEATAAPDNGHSSSVATAVTVASASNLNLRPALPADGPQGTATARNQIRTADAGSLTGAAPTASDADTPARGEPSQPSPAASDAAPTSVAPVKETARTDGEPTKTDTAKSEATKAEVTKPDASSEAKPEAKSEASAETKPADAKPVDGKADEPAPAAAKSSEAKSDQTKSDENKSDESKSAEGSEGKSATKAAEPDSKAAEGSDTPPKPDVALAPKRSGQIAAFVSGKDSRLYVRQDFAPLFDVPVEIATSDRPLGTHVFTARLDKDNGNAISWSVVSMPMGAHRAEAVDDGRATRRRKGAEIGDAKTAPRPNSAAEALDRLKIPPEAMARIAAELATGASLIVSDQGIASSETGAGTGFIIPLR